ncbi:MAG TPA: CBS domain-containing protein [Anaerolineae bacterium]|nr:CBS domain-containing protein [Anaerolineae bacterium]
MNSSFKLMSTRGIDLRIHITFPLILIWAAFQYGTAAGDATTGAVFGVVVILLLFVLVTLHELGHSFAAQYYGVPVKQIVLLPIGGLAQMAQIPENPKQEFVISTAGPAVNVVMAVLMGAMILVFNIPLTAPFTGISLTFAVIFSYIFYYNIMLALFNLLPAFPMDGGRIFRSLLAMKLNYVTATLIAGNVGRFIAVSMGIYGLLNGGIFLMLIALFIFSGASQEMMMVRFQQRKRRGELPTHVYLMPGHMVQEVHSPHVLALSPNDSLEQAMQVRMQGIQNNFPVVQNGRYLGFVTEAGLVNAYKQYGPDVMVYAAMSPAIKPISLTTDLVEALRRMDMWQVDALPVTDNGRLLGMITRRQITALAQTHQPWAETNPRTIQI